MTLQYKVPNKNNALVQGAKQGTILQRSSSPVSSKHIFAILVGTIIKLKVVMPVVKEALITNYVNPKEFSRM